MNKHRDKLHRFARGRHRRGKIMRFAMVFLPFVLLFSMCSAFMGHGHHRGHRNSGHGEFHHAQHGEFNRSTKGFRDNFQDVAPAPSVDANVSASIPSAEAQSENLGLDRLDIIEELLTQQLIDEEITSEQYKSRIEKEKARLFDELNQEEKSEEEAPVPAAAAAAVSGDSSNQTSSRSSFRGESRDHHRHRGFSPIGFLFAGLFKLGLLFLLLSFIGRRFGFRPWRQSLGFRRWQQAYADAWGTPVGEETPVAPEDEDEDDIARELEREEQRQQAQQAKQARQKKAQEDQTAKSEDVSDNSDDSDDSDDNDTSQPENKNAA